MDDILYRAFDLQRFEGNGVLAALIKDSERRYDSIVPFRGRILSDDQLELVNAAGDNVPPAGNLNGGVRKH
ncbi:MAG: hypothetical protein IJT00_01450 [Lachnospiraceae bacterium]|nr:hypothetical protein [Lachnospiraceae bacterium]